MKRKIFTLFVAAICSVTSLFAACPQYFHDTIPAQRYITNFEVVWQDTENPYDCPYVKFNDTFRPDLNLDRRYYISMDARHANDLNTGCKFRYITQADDPGASLHWNQYEYWPSHNDIQLGLGAHTANRIASDGGSVVDEKWTHMISTAVEKGVKEIIFFVNPQYKDVNAVTGETKWISFYGEAGGRERLYNINYFVYTLPNIVKNTLSAPKEVRSGNNLHIEGSIQAIGAVSYKLQENANGKWYTIQSGSISTAEARAGKTFVYDQNFGNGHAAICEYRIIATDLESGKVDTSEIKQTRFLYKETTTYRSPGEIFYTYKAEDCMEYQVTSELPVVKKLEGEMIKWTMPACDVNIVYQQPTYTVKFLDADYTLLKKQEVDCGDDAVAPANPSYGGYTFVGWSKDFTNVHGNMSVVAKYDIGSDYMLNTFISDHKNNVFPFKDFASSETRAMVGDKITLTADVFATTNASLYYETAQWLESEQRFNWIPNTGKKVDDYTTPGQSHWFDQEITICYDENTQYIHPFEYKVAFRFYMMIAGVKVYSDPYEIDVYYPITINSNTGDAVFAENTSGDYIQDVTTILPARYNDTVRVYSINGADGGCLSFARFIQPTRPFDYGTDENGDAFFICPGEQETINVSVNKVAVVFDNAFPTQPFDLSAAGISTPYNAYYAEVVNCGGSVQYMPADPEDAGYIFKGWEAWSTDYADDAYTRVPAGVGNIIGFSAQWEEILVAPQYTVKFFGKDSLNQIGTDQLVNEGENAVPPTAPEVAGYHFVGWNKPYTTITANTEIVALYGQDAVTWTVNYKNWDNSSLGSETVNDGEAAQGVVATRDGYTFIGWSEDISHVTSNMTVTAQFKVATYTITYTIDGKVVQTEEVTHNGWPIWAAVIENNFTTYKPADKDYEYTFMAWNPSIAAATADATYEAQYSYNEKLHTVIFQNWDHSKLDEQQVAKGSAAIAPADPTRVGYNFVGWDRSFDNVLADLVVTAVFEKITGIEEITIEQLQMTNKFLIDGHLYIVRPAGSIYDATGVQVR